MLQRLLHRGSARCFQSVTGMTRAEFARLLPAFTHAYAETRAAEQAQMTRRRQPGGGRRGQLPADAEKLLFILVSVTQYPVQELQGLLFGLGQSQASAWALRLLPILQAALGRELALPARKLATLDDLKAQCPDLVFLLDATERPIPRPQDADRQTACYSGKKKRHTLKNTVVANATGRKIVFLGDTTAGSRHDKRLVEDDAPPFPPGSRGPSDSGYQGYTVEGVSVLTPFKKPRGGELSLDEKTLNTQLSRHRIPVEHAIGGMKVARMLRDPFRNRGTDLADTAIVVATGLYNFKCHLRDAASAN
jgi:hypothetical protein